MPLTRYNKLVRDKILDITEASGKACTTEVLSEDEYLRMIDVKLDEELAEYHKTPNLEELADLLEALELTTPTGFSTSHVTNPVMMTGTLRYDKEKMLEGVYKMLGSGKESDLNGIVSISDAAIER